MSQEKSLWFNQETAHPNAIRISFQTQTVYLNATVYAEDLLRRLTMESVFRAGHLYDTDRLHVLRATTSDAPQLPGTLVVKRILLPLGWRLANPEFLLDGSVIVNHVPMKDGRLQPQYRIELDKHQNQA